MDDQIGRVMRVLAEKKMLNNTLIVFQSDNGGTRNPMFAGAITDMTKVVLPADNGPYRDGKGTLYEGGTRVVAVASWPGHIKEGSVVNEMIHTVDLYPTLSNSRVEISTKASLSTVWMSGAPSARGSHHPAQNSCTT